MNIRSEYNDDPGPDRDSSGIGGHGVTLIALHSIVCQGEDEGHRVFNAVKGEVPPVVERGSQVQESDSMRVEEHGAPAKENAIKFQSKVLEETDTK